MGPDETEWLAADGWSVCWRAGSRGWSGAESRTVVQGVRASLVRGKLGQYQVRRITRAKSERVRVQGKPEQGWVQGRQGWARMVIQETARKSCMTNDKEESGSETANRKVGRGDSGGGPPGVPERGCCG